jgi:hypothetical protein
LQVLSQKSEHSSFAKASYEVKDKGVTLTTISKTGRLQMSNKKDKRPDRRSLLATAAAASAALPLLQVPPKRNPI